jgi:hypothetical protein
VVDIEVMLLRHHLSPDLLRDDRGTHARTPEMLRREVYACIYSGLRVILCQPFAVDHYRSA